MAKGKTPRKPKTMLAVPGAASGRDRAEEALRESEERFRTVFESAPLGIAIAGRDSAFLASNQALQEMLGYSPEEMRALTIVDVTHPEDVDRTATAYEELCQGSLDRFRMEKRYVRKDGRVLWANAAVRVVHDEAGEFLYALAMVENITDRKRAEEALRESEGGTGRQS